MPPETASDKIVCPKCGFQQYKRSAICKKCGLIFDKWREMQAKKQKAERSDFTESEEDEVTTRVSPVLVVLALLAIAGAAFSLSKLGTGTPPPTTAQAPPVGAPGGLPGAGAPATPTGIQRLPVAPPPATAASAQAPRGGAGAAGVAVAERYEKYRADLGEAVQLLAAFEKKLKAGVDFKDMRQEFLDVRSAVARSFKEPPNEGWISYQAVDKALSAYSDSLKFWEYRVYSSDYRNKLWCAGDACPFPTEQDFKEAVGSYVNLCWDRAAAFRSIAERFLQYGDPLGLEADTTVKQEIVDTGKPVDDIWKKLGRPPA